MKWFKHDSDAHSDAKIKKLKHKYGITGYGLYWYCIELIARNVDKNNVTFELEEDAELIALEWGLDDRLVEDIMRFMVDLRLFEVNEARVTCFKLAFRLDETNSKHPEMKKIIHKLSGESPETVGKVTGDTPRHSDQTRLDKTRSDKTRLDETRGEKKEPGKSSRFVPPTLTQVHEYCHSRLNEVDAGRFIDFYTAKGWMVGKNKMKDWKAAVRNWERGSSKQQVHGMNTNTQGIQDWLNEGNDNG